MIFPPEKAILISRYSKLREVSSCSWPSISSSCSWPPISASKFIHLALIKAGYPLKIRDFSYTLLGNADDILEAKENVEYLEVFGEFRPGLVLVQGRPGSGKTTLVHKVCRDWAVDGSTLRQAHLVLLVSLRLVHFKKCDSTMTDLLGILYPGEESRTKMATEIEQDGGKGVCFILDGLDEYPQAQENSTVISQLLNGIYPFAMVIVTSRHSVTFSVRRRADKMIEVLGLSKQQVFNYINAFPFKEDNAGTSATELQSYLSCHSNVLHLCYLPMHSAMLCYLYDQQRDLPTTETKIYEAFTLLTLKRANPNQKITDLEHLQEESNRLFKELCKLAFDMCMDSKQVVHRSEPETTLFGGLESLGFLKVDVEAALLEIKNTYSFHHLTFQEFLAAYHVAGLEEQQQLDLIKSNSGKLHHLIFGGMMWKFYFGLVDFQHKEGHLEALMASATSQFDCLNHLEAFMSLSSQVDCLYLIHSAFQSQQKLVCDRVLQCLEGCLFFEGHTITTSDINSLKFVTTTSSLPVLALSIKHFKSNFPKENSDALRTILRSCKHLKSLTVCNGNVDSDGAEVLGTALAQCTHLEQLGVSRNSIGSAGAIALVKALRRCSCVSELNFSKTDMELGGVVALSASMQNWSSLIKLDLSHNAICKDGPNALFYTNILCCSHPALSLVQHLKHCEDTNSSLDLAKCEDAGSYGMNALAKGLSHCRCLKVLRLQNIGFGLTDAAALASGIKYCDDLEELDLSYNACSPFGMGFLSAALKTLGNLKCVRAPHNSIGYSSYGITAFSAVMRSCALSVLDLSQNNITPEGAEELGKALRSCRNLTKLDISNNNIKYGAAALPVGLHHCTNLIELDVSDNDMGEEAEYLAGGLAYCKHLQKVHISNNNIGPRAAKAVAEALAHSKRLTVLDLNSNNIETEGAHALANTLQLCTQVKELHLHDNAIGDDGCKALSVSFKVCTSITKLVLSSNNVGPEGAAALAEGLQSCSHLRFLELDGNIIGDGAAALAKVTLSSPFLHLRLNCNNITTSGALALAAGWEEHSHNHTLNIMGNDIGKEGLDALSKTTQSMHFSSIDSEKTEEELSDSDFERMMKSMLSVAAHFGFLDARTLKRCISSFFDNKCISL